MQGSAVLLCSSGILMLAGVFLLLIAILVGEQ